eukprot:jgi/Ulvmu1/10458/UM063_0013.1
MPEKKATDLAVLGLDERYVYLKLKHRDNPVAKLLDLRLSMTDLEQCARMTAAPSRPFAGIAASTAGRSNPDSSRTAFRPGGRTGGGGNGGRHDSPRQPLGRCPRCR